MTDIADDETKIGGHANTQDDPPGPTQSNNLSSAEKDQAAAHTSPQALVIHEIVRNEGEEELARSSLAVAWSGLAAGLSMGFSFLAMALIQSGLPDTPSRRLIDSAGYSLGFVIVVLGRQQLFTESTLTAVLPLLVKRNWETFRSIVRFWAVVLSANLIGTFIFAALISINGLFPAPVETALGDIARASMEGEFWPTLIKAMFAGWLIALMVWLLPSARSARLFVILLLTYVVSVGRFSHIIAGSVEATYAVLTGQHSVVDYLTLFLAPTILGNTIGGVALVAILNYAPLAPELRD